MHRAIENSEFPPPGGYTPDRESLSRHPVPAWYAEAKLGIFVHWSVPSVPAFAPRDREIGELLRTRYRDLLPLSPYSEWYENAIKFSWSPSARHHREVHRGRPYESFATDFVRGLEQWDPGAWADAFAESGARWVVMVTKHHDGFCLWPSRHTNPHRRGWESPRDCVGELGRAVRARGLRFGLYYSGGIDWSFEPRPVRTFLDFAASIPGGDYPAHAEAQVRELIERYAPDVLWNDIAWPGTEASLFQLFADYYAAVPEGLVNDRWITPGWLLRALRITPLRRLLDRLLERAVRRPGASPAPPASAHWDVRTPEYAVFDDIQRDKWECVRGIDKSFGFNRNSRPQDFLDRHELIWSFVDLVSKNGNLLLNVGPRGEDGVIPEDQRLRLRWLGRWLSRNGRAIYATRPWTRAEGKSRQGLPLRFTRGGGALHAILIGTPAGGSVTLMDVPVADGAEITLQGHGPVPWRREGGDLRVELPPLPDEPAHALSVSRIHSES